MDKGIIMDQVTVKRTKKGWTVYVPSSQCDAFQWILSEGMEGLAAMIDDGQQVIESQDDWNGIEWKI